MSSKKTAVFVRDLVPGVPQTIEAGCEFVFIERARELTIVADSNRMNGRRSGDNLRFDQPVKSVTIESSIEQRVELVLGFGDFNRMIIEGRLVLDQRIETNALNTDLLPVEFTKTYGLVSDVETVYAENTQLAITPVIDTSGSNFARGFFEWDHSIYLIDKTNIYIYDYEGNLKSTTPLVGALSWVMGGDVDPQSGNAFLVVENGISKVNLYTGAVSSVYGSSGLYAKVGYGAHMVGRELVFIKSTAENGYQSNEVLYRFNVDTNQLSEVPLTGYTGTFSSRLSIDRENGELLQSLSGGNGYQAFDAVTQKYLGARYYAATQSGGYLSRKKNVFVTGNTNSLKINTIDAVTFAARLYIQDGQDIGTRREFNIRGDYGFLNRGAGVVLRGNIVAAILQGLDIGGGLGSNYLDYVVSLMYTDGNYALVRDAGSSSFAYRGFDDVGELFLESEATIKVLPQYLTGQI